MELNPIKSSLAPGSIVAGRFKIVRHLATGSMGSVFLAIDGKLGNTEVALKILHSKFLNDQVVFSRFSNEVVLARQLTHPNIVRIHDFEETRCGQKLICMEYVEGTTLGHLIQEIHGSVSFVDVPTSALYEVDFKRLLEIYKKLLSGVSFAHKAGILHRDLKPFNVLLDKNDQPKIGDFGLATVAGVSSGLTNDGNALMGTPDYMAPEQVLGHRSTARSDIYALGAIAFELVTGRPPFIGEGPLAIAYMQVQAPFPSLDRLPEFIPRTFLQLIKRSTYKNPHERFSSVDEMIELLEGRAMPGEIHSPTFHGRGFGAKNMQRKSTSTLGFDVGPQTFSRRYPKLFKVMSLTVAVGLGVVIFVATSIAADYLPQITNLRPTEKIVSTVEAVKVEEPAPPPGKKKVSNLKAKN